MITDDLEMIEQLLNLPREQLLTLWEKYAGKPASPKLHPQLMYPVLAYKIQEQAFGGLRSEAAQLLLADSSKPAPAKSVRKVPKLLREWRGETHEVLMLEEGFEYRGRTYKSLSRIAREITGTQWSGPAFFGTKDKKK